MRFYAHAMHLNLQLTALVIPNDATLLPTSASLVGKEQAIVELDVEILLRPHSSRNRPE